MRLKKTKGEWRRGSVFTLNGLVLDAGERYSIVYRVLRRLPKPRCCTQGKAGGYGISPPKKSKPQIAENPPEKAGKSPI
jgi:hypothetical protein